MGAQSLNHCTTREVPDNCLLLIGAFESLILIVIIDMVGFKSINFICVLSQKNTLKKKHMVLGLPWWCSG